MSDDESSIDGSLEEFLAREGIKSFGASGKTESGSARMDDGAEIGAIDYVDDNSLSFADDLDINMVDLLIPSASKINAILRSNGQDPISLTKHDIDASKKVSVYVVDAWAQSTLSCLLEMSDRIDQHSTTVKAASIHQRKNEVSREALEARVGELQERLLDSERRAKSSDLQLQKLLDQNDGNAVKSKTTSSDSKRTIKNLEDKVQESERRVRQKDVELERLKEKLRNIAEKEKETAKRHRNALVAIKDGSLSDTSFGSLNDSNVSKSNISLNDSRLSVSSSRSKSTVQASMNDLVEALQSQRDGLEKRNAELDSQVNELTTALRDAQNGIVKKTNKDTVSDSASENDDEDTRSETAQAMYDKIKEQSRKIDQLVHRIEIHKSSEQESGHVQNDLKKRNNEMREEIENLRLEMETRPSPRQWATKQKEMKDIEDKLHDLVMMRGEAAELAAWKKHMSVSDRIKVDKRNHELGLWVLDSLPKAVTKEVLQSVCRELDVSDVSEVQPNLAKLKAVVKAVPRMERFISQVCSFLFERDRRIRELGGKGFGGRDRPTMEDVLPILQNWHGEVQQLEGLAQFQDRILSELHRREQLLALESVNNPDFGPGMRFRWSNEEISKVFTVVREMVDFEVEVMKHKKSFRAAEDFIREQPELMVNRQLSHIQYLFNIPSLDGLFPRMNQIYLQVEQMTNFLNTARHALDLKTASDAALIAEVTMIVTQGKGGSE